MTHGAHKPLIFISDLHLQDSRPELTDALVRFLAEQRGACEALYILGDLFEVWLGDDDTGRCGDRVSEALRDFTRSGSRLFLMHGNRDFLMGERFAAQSGAELIQEPYRLKTAYGDILLLHGDSLCTDDLNINTFENWCAALNGNQNFLQKASKKERNLRSRRAPKARRLWQLKPRRSSTSISSLYSNSFSYTAARVFMDTLIVRLCIPYPLNSRLKASQRPQGWYWVIGVSRLVRCCVG